MQDIDLLIIGAGPAGTAAALTALRHARLRVCVLEGTHFDQPRIGENATGALRPLLRHLGAEDALGSAAVSMPCLASQAAWGSDQVSTQDSLTTGLGDGMLLDRRRFDETLAGLVEAHGGHVMRGAWLRGLDCAAAAGKHRAWRVAIDRSGTGTRLQARFVIDATGRRAAFARRAGGEIATLDRLVAVSAFVDRGRDCAMPPTVLVEATPDGWWYSAPLPGGRAVVSFLTDADLLATSRMAGRDVFITRLQATTATSHRLRGCTRPDRPRVHLAASQALRMPCGDGWLAAGDAALAQDPLSSAGIGHALACGMQAGYVALEGLRGESRLAQAYPRDVSMNMRDFLLQRARVYMTEQRWPDSPFWRRRHLRQAEGEARTARAPGRQGVVLNADVSIDVDC